MKRELVGIVIDQSWENCVGLANDGTAWAGRNRGGNVEWRRLNDLPQDPEPESTDPAADAAASVSERQYAEAQRSMRDYTLAYFARLREMLTGMEDMTALQQEYAKTGPTAEWRAKTAEVMKKCADTMMQIELPENDPRKVRANELRDSILSELKRYVRIDEFRACPNGESAPQTNQEQTTKNEQNAYPANVKQALDQFTSENGVAPETVGRMSQNASIAQDALDSYQRDYHMTTGAIEALRLQYDEVSADIAYLENARKDHQKNKKKKAARDCKTRLFSLRDVQARIAAAIKEHENDLPGIANGLAQAQEAQASS